MLLLGHTGITIGITWLAQESAAWLKALPVQRQQLQVEARNADPPVEKPRPALDYRLLLVGSMLPDIIDKPLGVWLLSESLSNGRIFGHTLLLAVLLLGAGLYLYLGRRRVGVLCLTLGTLAHLVLDQMWLNPRTLLWPLYGLSFDRVAVEGWLPRILNSLVTEPAVYIPEIIGGVLLALFFWNLIRQGRLNSFLRSGRVESHLERKQTVGEYRD